MRANVDLTHALSREETLRRGEIDVFLRIARVSPISGS
jgi:hypothetical protein